jgi:hypothetical protein
MIATIIAQLGALIDSVNILNGTTALVHVTDPDALRCLLPEVQRNTQCRINVTAYAGGRAEIRVGFDANMRQR